MPSDADEPAPAASRVLPRFDREAAARQRRRDRQQIVATGLALTVVLVAVAALAGRGTGGLGVVERVEEVVLDSKFRVRGAIEPSPRLALVEIDEETIERYGQFPFGRDVIGDALVLLGALGAEQVLVDLVFSEPAGGIEDGSLLSSLEQAPAPVTLGYFFYTDRAEGLSAMPRFRAESFREGAAPLAAATPPDEGHLLRATGVQPVLDTLDDAAGGVGFLNVRVDHGGIVRRAQLVIAHGDRVYPSAEVVAAAIAALGTGGEGSPAYLAGGPYDPVLHIAERTVPLDPSGAALINYPGPSGTFPTVSLLDLLDGAGDPARRGDLEAVLDGRTVLLGPSAVGIWDRRDTPFGASVPSMEIHAAILDNLLEDRFLRRPAGLLIAEWGLVLLLGVLLTLLLARAPVSAGAVTATVAAAVVVGLDLALLFPSGLWVKWLLPLGSLALLFVVLATLRSRQEVRLRRLEREARDAVEQLFGRYVAPAVVREMLDRPEAVRIGGDRREISVLFSDVRGFTTISEHGDPEQIAAVLNEYFTAMSDAIQEHRGMVDKYMGDGIMALFGAPLPDDGHAALACAAAVAKLGALGRLNDRLRHRGLLREPLRIGIGINTGHAAVGNMGSVDRFEYTAIGDEVNLGSRLEGLTKQFGVACLVTDATRAAAGGRFVFREIDRVRVKGRDAAVAIHELVGPAGAPVPPHHARYTEALAHFRGRRWSEAEAICAAILDDHPDDGPTRHLLARVRQYHGEPPPPGWTGSYRAVSK